MVRTLNGLYFLELLTTAMTFNCVVCYDVNVCLCFLLSATMSTSDNDSDVSEDGILLKIDSKGSKDCNVSVENM